ncbi:MAG: group III truncated hemoglobin [Xanthomonadaceae bacterium]|nr:group III truncated hemoglobin [Xanthomonadaceae bacterium]
MSSSQPNHPVSASPCCTEEEVVELVNRFYALVRQDPELGPIFEQRIDDWDAHLSILVGFWSTLLRGTRRFNGAPMPKHMALPGLNPPLFHRWLALFGQITTELGNPALKSQADAHAKSMAERFWQRYRVQGYDILNPAFPPASSKREKSA